MSLINDLIGTPLGYLMNWCYLWVGNYGAAILLFTLLTKIILFPLSLMAQKNSIKMVRMAPELDDIKRYNSGNGELIAQEIRALYKKERYSTTAGVLPLLVQIPIILGLINVIYNPLQHLMRLDRSTIAELTGKAAELLGKGGQDLGYSGQILVLEKMREAPEAFAGLSGTAQALSDAAGLHMIFLGINLSETPAIGDPTMLIPILSGLSALVLCLVQNKYNVLQETASFANKWGMTIFLTAFSAYFAAVLPSGLGLYWTAANLISIPVLWVCNTVFDPKKHLDYEAMADRHREGPKEKRAARSHKMLLKGRSKEDLRRFFAKGNKRELVVYSEASGFYKYFKGYVEHILTHSDIDIHYVTSDPHDRIFEAEEPRIKPYYIGDKDLVALFMKMDADVFLMTTPDLDKYQLKRSLVSKRVEYIYTDHGMTSFHLMLREGALDHFDTVFLCGPNHISEVRQTEYVYRLPQKRLVKTGFALLDDLLERASALGRKENERKKILIAPSWQRDNLLDFCLDEIMNGLAGKDYDIVIRPHPEFVKRFPHKVKKIEKRFADRLGKDMELETDFSSSESVYTADVVVTDWSSVAQEYSYTTKKPSLFINTPMKTVNPNYEKIKAIPLDISLRDKIGVQIDTGDLAVLGEICEKLIADKEKWREEITGLVEHYIYNIGDGAKNGAKYIIGRIKDERKARAS